jgi:hypothetical protein
MHAAPWAVCVALDFICFAFLDSTVYSRDMTEIKKKDVPASS